MGILFDSVIVTLAVVYPAIFVFAYLFKRTRGSQ